MSHLTKLAAGGLLVAVCTGSYFYFNRPEAEAAHQATDDAFVQADFTNVASRIAGVVEKVLVEENQTIHGGDTLAILDDRDLRIAVENAKAVIAANAASIRTLDAQFERQGALIAEAQAAVSADDAALRLARANEARMRKLQGLGAATERSFDEAVSNLESAKANRDSHVAALNAARRQLDVLSGQRESARASLAQAEAGLADANLRLSYTKITAPISGTIGQKSMRIGSYVTVGTTLLSIVPLDQLYVRANFREMQLARVRPGQTVEIKVDALPGQIFMGTVDSLGPASGVSYSAIAPQNATGNFTKIAQRLPVRIRIEPDQAGIKLLRVGMSVVPNILVADCPVVCAPKL